MKIICGIYKISSPSGKIYIGQSINILKRFRAYKNIACKEQTLIANSLKKHGVENHVFDIIHECLQEELNDLEIYYIKFYNSFNSKVGLNLKAGGQGGGVCSEASKQKLRTPKSEATKQKFRIAALNRKPISEETREKFRKHMMGNKNLQGKKVALGLKRSEETKALIREKRKLQIMKTGYKRPDVSFAMIERNRLMRENGCFDNAIAKSSKPIICTLNTGEEINFPSIKEASRKLHTCEKSIKKHIENSTQHRKGWRFIFK